MSAVLASRGHAGTKDGPLVAEVLRGDEQAAAELFRRYHRRLVQRMIRWASDSEHAEDLAQEAWLKAVAALDRFDDSAAFWPWLRTIGDNTARSDLRITLTQGGERRVTPVDERVLNRIPAPIDEHRRVDESSVLTAALADLPARQRGAFLAVAGGSPASEVAQRFGVNDNAFRQLYHRARQGLRRHMDGMLGTAPVLWLQRAGGTFRDSVRIDMGLGAVHGSPAAIATIIALIIVTPVLGPMAIADGNERPARLAGTHDEPAPVTMHEAARMPAASRPDRSDSVREQAIRPEPERPAVQIAPPGSAIPDAVADETPIRVDQEAPEDPDVRYGARVGLPNGDSEQIDVESKGVAAQPVHETACEVADAAPAAYCEAGPDSQP